MRKLKDRGITLIALVVTIVVLLILAATSISMLSGDNGIIKQAQSAKKENVLATEEEQIKTAQLSTTANRLGEDWNVGDLQEELDRTLGEGKTKVTYNEDDSINVWFSETKHNYNITGNQVTQLEDSDFILGDESWYVYEDVEGGVKITDITEEVKNNTTLNILFSIYIENPDLAEDAESEDETIKAQAEKKILELYEAKKEEAKIYKNVGNIPAQINGKDVVEIGDNAFYYLGLDLEYVTIPNTVKKIGEHAFYRNTIINLEIPESVVFIGEDAFEDNNLKFVEFKGKCPEIIGDYDFGEGIFGRSEDLGKRRIKVPKGEKINYEKVPLYALGISSYEAIYE